MRHKGTQSIETERLVLRRLAPSDAEEMFHNWANDPEVTKFLRWVPHQNPEETRQLLETWEKEYQQPDHYLWGIVRKSDGALMGSIGIIYDSEGDGHPAGWCPGYCIGQAFWNKGYTTEALQAVLGYFLEDSGVTELWCCHASSNPASGEVMKRAGFVYQGEATYHKFGGEAVPAYYYHFKLQQ